MDPRRLYESPFTDLNNLGVAGMFPPAEVRELVTVINAVKDRTAA